MFSGCASFQSSTMLIQSDTIGEGGGHGGSCSTNMGRCGTLCEVIRLLNIGHFASFCKIFVFTMTDLSCMLPKSALCLQTDASDHKRMIF